MFKKDPLQIIPFRTYGTDKLLYLKGRALEDEQVDFTKKGWFNLLINSWKQFETDEIRHSALRIRLANKDVFLLETDAEGYYQLNSGSKALQVHTDCEDWLHYEVSFAKESEHRTIQYNNVFKGQMLIPQARARFGVISDIDDTILHTGVTSRFKWKVAVNTILRPPEKRKALQGSAEFYRNLHFDTLHNCINPVFYVSNSPWNLYRYLEFFLSTNEFPKGPILLRDFRTPFDRTPKLEQSHKLQEICNIFESYPNLPMILIGDCGEKDPYIYLEMVKKYSVQVAAIYLRAVDHSTIMKKVDEHYKAYCTVPYLIVKDTNEASEHAKDRGFIA